MELYPLLVPAGSDTEIQYNDGNLFGADSTFTINDVTKIVDMDGLTITGTTAIGLDMSGGTFATAAIIIPDEGYIGSASDTDAISIADGEVTISNNATVVATCTVKRLLAGGVTE